MTIQSTGNAIDFGDMAVATSGGASGQSPTRGLFLGGSPAPTSANRINTIQFLTMSTLGNPDFGDLQRKQQILVVVQMLLGLLFLGV